MPKILVIDDDPAFALMLKAFLQRNQFDVDTAYTAANGLKVVKENFPDLVLTDFRLPDTDGIELLLQIKKVTPDLPVILMTTYADIKTAVRAIKLGALEYITKPVNPEEVLLLIQNELRDLQETQPVHYPDESNVFIRGESERATKIESLIQKVAPTNLTVIIEGESGTGKEFIARTIHKCSKRRSNAFITLECGTISSESAIDNLISYVEGNLHGINGANTEFEGGTLYLDNVTSLPDDVQVKLMRALQRNVVEAGDAVAELNMRIIAASNEDLLKAVIKGQFRADLYHRLNEFKIKLPPLRERDSDILIFAQHFLAQANQELSRSVKGFSHTAKEAILNYRWPGNLRELKNVVKRAVLLSKEDIITAQVLPPEMLDPRHGVAAPVSAPISSAPVFTPSSLPKNDKEQNERNLILKTLEKVRYNKSKAARLLNIDRKTLYNKLKQYNIEA